MDDILKEINDWVRAEELAGRRVDIDRYNRRLQMLVDQQNTAPRPEFNGLSREQMFFLIYQPFSDRCVVKINELKREQYEKIPLIRQTLFLLDTISKTELKLTKLGWLPLKIVAEAYPLGQPEYIIEEFNQKRINEYDAKSVRMARSILEILGWIKKRNGKLSVTAKGTKALADIDSAANRILYCALCRVGLSSFDEVDDNQIGNLGIAYSVWLLNKFSSEWVSGFIYQEHYQQVVNNVDIFNIYATRVFGRLLYWLGVVENRRNPQSEHILKNEYRKTDLFPIVFAVKNG